MSSQDEPAGDPYGAIKFGEFRKYMQNKKNKLKRQERELKEQASQELPQIFAGTSIYINGYCDPPASELRRMILQHGGDYQHYLKKLSVTHIIATNLTNSKLQEFRAYKVVKPNWIVDSIHAKQLLPWQNYRLVSKSSGQKELPFPTKTAKAASAQQQPQPQHQSGIQTASTVQQMTPLPEPAREPKIATPSPTTGEALNADLLKNKWAREVSTVNPAFIKRYYETSRLHYLSTWKHEIKNIVEALESKYDKTSNEYTATVKKRKQSTTRVVMHIDFDCFFASVGIKDRPHLKDKPVAVTHSRTASEKSKSDIASCNYVARSYGVYNGMHIGTAKRLCPELHVIPYEFEKYKAVSTKFYEIIFQYADELQAVSVDEALIEVGSRITDTDSSQREIEDLAKRIRADIRDATGCEVSIGIGPNILVARMSTRKAKPAGQYMCKNDEEVEHLLDDQHVGDLPGVGYAIAEKLKDLNVERVGDLRKVPLYELQSKVGEKMGKTLYDFARGIDDRPLITHQVRRSVSAEVNWGVRFENEENQTAFIEGLAEEISNRLKKYGIKGKTITVKILKRKPAAEEPEKQLGHGSVDAFSKSYNLANYTDSSETINKHVYDMVKSFHFHYAEIRGLGIHISRLNNQEPTISADQGRLDFTKSPGTAKRKLPPTSTEVRQSTDTVQPPPKEIMEVNAQTFNELPKTVQEELKAAYDIRFIEAIAEERRQLETPQKNVNVETVQQTPMHHLAETPPSMNLSPAELPPWSQLDPSSLLAFPEKTRVQILKLYGEKNQSKMDVVTEPNDAEGRARQITPEPNATTTAAATNTTTAALFSPNRTTTPRTTINSRSRPSTPKSTTGNRTPKSRRKIDKSSANTVTITQLFQMGGNNSPSARRAVLGSPSADAIRSPSSRLPTTINGRFYSVFGQQAEPANEVEGEEHSLNMDFLNELPEDVRAELLHEHRLLKRTKAMRPSRIDEGRSNTIHHKEVIKRIDLAYPKEPTLQETANIEQLRNLLSQWINSYDGKPEDGDVETVKSYLIDLVKYPDLEKVGLLVAYLRYLVKSHPEPGSWETIVKDIQDAVNAKVITIYGCPLQF